jgi:hypothetical protein
MVHGQLYGYYRLLAATRADFGGRDPRESSLQPYETMEQQFRSALRIQSLMISHDGLLYPACPLEPSRYLECAVAIRWKNHRGENITRDKKAFMRGRGAFRNLANAARLVATARTASEVLTRNSGS